MSSHHIIRDKQEPALIIEHLSQTDVEILGQVLEWSPTVLALESSIDKIISQGFKIDVAVVSEDHFEKYEQLLQDQYPILIKKYRQGLPLDMAIAHLTEKEYPAAIVVNDRIGMYEILELFRTYVVAIHLTFISNNVKFTYSASGHFEKWLPAGSELILQQSSAVVISGDYKSSFDKDTYRMVTQTDGIFEVETPHELVVGETLK